MAYFLTEYGEASPWDGKLSSIQPFRTDIILDTEVELELINKRLNSGKYDFFVGYALAGESSIYYTANSIRFYVLNPL